VDGIILARISAPLLPPRDGIVGDSYARMAGATAVDWSDPLLRAARLVVLILVPSPMSTLVLMTPAAIVSASSTELGIKYGYCWHNAGY
jgi:hypothetical protein